MSDRKTKPVPFRRLSRLRKFGGMTAGVAGRMAVSGAKQMMAGEKPSLQDLLLTPSNAAKITEKLADMRGAAMKMGQILSMDSGEFLPPEFADILADLRSDAYYMPDRQLEQVLSEAWGESWEGRFKSFDRRPVAAASIGQVHRAQAHDGTDLAVKVQYPGVKDSIDSDINNMGTLIKMTGLLPAHVDLPTLLEEGRAQLKQEADYSREADYLTRFGALLEGDEDFHVPQFYPDLSTDAVLAMSFAPGKAIEAMADAPQDVRDDIIVKLMTLVLRELFEFGLMQTDPNFANYLYNEDRAQIILLDFGASREIASDIADQYRVIARAFISGDSAAVLEKMVHMQLLPPDMPFDLLNPIMELIDIACEPVSRDEIIDFGDRRQVSEIRDRSMALAENRSLWHVPPVELMFIHRKIGGVLLLAARLEARVNVHALLKTFVA